MTNIRKTEAFLREQFAGCAFFKEHPTDGEYRLQHSYRVAYAARGIARREGLDEEGLIIGWHRPFWSRWNTVKRLSNGLGRVLPKGSHSLNEIRH